jgi:hypothetical protein
MNNINSREDENFLDIDTETKDWTLEIILGAVEAGVEVPITLNVGGLVITGSLISEREFLEKVLYGKIYEKYKQGMQEISSSETDSEDNESENKETSQSKVYRFIHLKNAEFYYSTGINVEIPEGLLWRGLLSSVDGYFLK